MNITIHLQKLKEVLNQSKRMNAMMLPILRTVLLNVPERNIKNQLEF